MTDRSEQIDSILSAAVELPDARARAEYIHTACDGDSDLQRQVEELVAAYLSAGDFLESPASRLPPTIDLGVAETAATQLGRYKLLQQIGEGGFAVVFMAEQEQPVRRRVAVKIIKLGMDSRQVIARFEAERQALAMMDHSNIAKVLDAGTTESGRPYFVMELVKGTPITDYCDEHSLSIEDRLALFSQVCDAVQHAHQKGIIHRDIKPSNVLVRTEDDRPVVKVIDFGIAKATETRLTDKTLFTDFRQLIGTPAYMSPEQAEGSLDIDTRSDVYSLGVLLYELLSGLPPFDPKELKSKAIAEMQRIIREVEPPTPSARLNTLDDKTRVLKARARGFEPKRLAQRLRGELDWIALRALEKDRNRRYRSAAAMADDIERYLTNQTVEARPATPGYRFRKFARRNKASLFITSLVFTTLLMLIAGLAISNRLIAHERNQTAAALKSAEMERRRAEENFRQARIAIRDIWTRPALGIGEWSDVPLPLRKKMAQMAAKYYENLVQHENDKASAQFETAVAYRSLSSLYEQVGEYEESEKLGRQSIEILEKLVSGEPNNLGYLQQLGWSHFVLGWTFVKTDRLEQARSTYRQAAKYYEEILSLKPTEVDYTVELAQIYYELGHVVLDADQLREAEQAFQRSVEIFESLYAGSALDDADGEVLNRYAWACSGLAETLARAHRTEEAGMWRIRAAEVRRNAIKRAPQQGKYWYALGWDQYRSGNMERAIEAIAKSLELRRVEGDAYDCFIMALAHQKLGHNDEARAWYDKGLQSKDRNALRDNELVRLQAEATELLGITRPRPGNNPSERFETQATSGGNSAAGPADSESNAEINARGADGIQPHE